MTLSEAQELEVRHLLQNRWPNEVNGTRDETWISWRESLSRFDYLDVVRAIKLISEANDRFPALSRLMLGCQVLVDERKRVEQHEVREHVLAGFQPSTLTVEERLRQFDQAAVNSRRTLHAELAQAQQHEGGLDVEQLTAAHAAIDAVGPFEVKARELLATGVDSGTGARAMVGALTDALGAGNTVTLRRVDMKPAQRDDVPRPGRPQTRDVTSTADAAAHVAGLAATSPERNSYAEAEPTGDFNPERVADEVRRFPGLWSEERKAALSDEQRAAVNRALRA